MAITSRVRTNLMKIAAAALIIGAIVVPVSSIVATSQPRDNDANSIMWGGAYSKQEWLNKVNGGDGHNAGANIANIYYNENRGISEASFMSDATSENGEVTKDGRVLVDGLVVATNAITDGRGYINPSTADYDVWSRPPSVSFGSASIPAFVNMEGGVFHYAVIKSCGNPVKATPVPQPTPAPTPVPTPIPTPTPSPSPKSSFACESLKVSQPDKTNKPSTFHFTVTPNVSNTTVTGYEFNFGDNSALSESDTASVDHAFAAGTWNVTSIVKTPIGNTPVSKVCSAKVTVAAPPTLSPTPTPTPVEQGQVLGAALPATGPEAALGGIAGLSAIGYASKSYLRSRKSLLSSLRHKNNKVS